jgi:hypothetical protein
MRFVLAAWYPPYSPTRHEVCPETELAQNMLHAEIEHRYLECPALQLVYNMARESRVCRERTLNLSELTLVRQNRVLVMTQKQVVHLGYCVDTS